MKSRIIVNKTILIARHPIEPMFQQISFFTTIFLSWCKDNAV